MQQLDRDERPAFEPILEIEPAMNVLCRKNHRYRVLIFFLADELFLVRCIDTGRPDGELTQENSGEVIGEVKTDYAAGAVTLMACVAHDEDPPACFEQQYAKLCRDEADRTRLRQAAPLELGLGAPGYLQ